MNYFNNHYSRFEIILFRDFIQTIDGFFYDSLFNGTIISLPSFFLYAFIFIFECIFPSFLFIIFYLLSFQRKNQFWKELLMLKMIFLFWKESTFSPSSFSHLWHYWLLCNVNFYHNYFFYDECIICLEKRWMGIISPCCPYVRTCQSCQRKITRCPICKS